MRRVCVSFVLLIVFIFVWIWMIRVVLLSRELVF